MPDFESRPRKLPGADKDEREMLPVKEDGKWKRVKGKHTKASRRAAGDDDDDDDDDKAPAPAPVDPEVARKAELERLARKVEEDAATGATKKVAIAKLGQQIVEAPQKHVGLLKDLLDMANRDRSPVVQRLALLSCVSSLLDLLPAYRIRLPTEKELAMQVSAEVGMLRSFEKKYLDSYEGCVATLGRTWLRLRTGTHA